MNKSSNAGDQWANSSIEPARDQWVTRMGFILATVGSAVGLGNLWRFPYVAGQNGGGAFLFVYLLMVILLGCTVTLAELTLGRHTQLNALGAYRKLRKKWAWVGGMGIFAALIIMFYYSVVGGWVLKFVVAACTGQFTSNDPAVCGQFFANFASSAVEPIIYTAIFLLATAMIVYRGVSSGIEKASKVLMPLLFLFIVVLVIRSVTLPGASTGLAYFLVPDFSAINGKTILTAMGQVFYSLSLGMGIMVTYGSYLDKQSNMVKSSIIVPMLDTLAAVLAGLAILPAVFVFGFSPDSGPGLMFSTLPAVFSQMPLGQIFAILFFVLVFFAALTSTISLLEVVVTYLIDEKKFSRRKSAILATTVIFIFTIPASLSMGPWADIHFLPGMGFFSAVDYLSSNILLPIAGFLLCIFIGWVWGVDKAIYEITNEGSLEFKLAPVWAFLIKYVAPIAILLIFINALGFLG
ncbi:MAG: sodium-dependent transporter [Syntrophomonadaceae bacterium]|nr:sodium-dependent transporter [Syntrophomonadaceae bacterium]MDD4550314.1 sodium-dependent transporter [Syntrophomonadaceae bacterium]